jgi:hypothetical protein
MRDATTATGVRAPRANRRRLRECLGFIVTRRLAFKPSRGRRASATRPKPLSPRCYGGWGARSRMSPMAGHASLLAPSACLPAWVDESSVYGQWRQPLLQQCPRPRQVHPHVRRRDAPDAAWPIPPVFSSAVTMISKQRYASTASSPGPVTYSHYSIAMMNHIPPTGFFR